jgi:hypothetical protein
MSLSPGIRLGPYQILGPIGAGGMGEVYRARDTRLDREVAVKVLPAELSHDATRLHRFEQEARLAGSLNHPNVLTVYDVGSHEGAPYLVTELLEGRSLREALTSGPLPTRKAVDDAQQIAHGLAAAHAREIVHRDLKPANVFVTKDGRVKILDFGLAKLTQVDLLAAEGSAVSTKTAEGRIVGTVGYMAPEQVRGQTIDARSDIFAFGAVLYEMLTGERAFRAETTADTLTAILTKDPKDTARPGHPVPPALDRLVRRCLEKDPEERFQSARDVAFALDVESGSSRSGEVEAPAIPGRRWRRWAITAAVALLAAAAGAWVSHRFWSQRSPPPRLLQLTFGRGITEAARFTADGHTIVYTAYWDGKPPEILSRRLDQPESVSLGLPPARLLSVSSQGELAVLLTPPDESGITRVGTLARVPLSGGAVRPLLEDVVDADWSPDGQELAVVQYREGRYQLEYPVGTVLYQSAQLAFPRVSPRGDRVAIRDRGRVLLLVNRAGGTTRIEVGSDPSFWGLHGLAWFPRGDALLVTVGDPDLLQARTLRRVTLDGTVTELYVAPGTVVVEDMARDGRILLHHGFERLGVRGRPPGDPEEHELVGVQGALARGYSADGRRVLVASDEPSTQFTYLGPLTGEAPMRLGAGLGMGLSGDARWAVLPADPADPGAHLILMPTSAGEALRFDTAQLKAGIKAGKLSGRIVWHLDGDRVGFNGAEPGRPPRAFVFERSTGQTRAVTPENTLAMPGLAPDGHVLAYAKDGSLAFHPLAEGDPQPLPARLPPDWQQLSLDGEFGVLRVSSDGRFLFLREGGVSARIERLELATGRKTPWKVLRPTDPTGVWGTFNHFLTPDGEGYAYTYGRVLNDLYLLEGLRF